MKTSAPWLLSLMLASSFTQADAPAADGQAPAALQAAIAELDAAMFDAFNRCEDPAQLERHASYFAPGVEFYHDTGGVTWDRDSMIANTGKYACGNYRRELVAGSLRVYAVKDFGAIAQGVHRFCQVSTSACEGEADFAMVWQQAGERWQVTRVLSYGHRPAPMAAH